MECFDNISAGNAFSDLSISKAPSLRCTGGKFTSCGNCEGCEIGGQLAYTKQWFPRCAEQTKRQFVLGLVHRFRSQDLHDSINNLLNTLEGKDFTYARSRNRPSLKEDVSTSSSNHALDKWQLSNDMCECLNWFESSRYWTKYNFMLGLMQVCNAQLLRIIGNESRSISLLNNSQQDGKEQVDDGAKFSTVQEDSTDDQMLSKRMLVNESVGARTVCSEQDGDQCESSSLKVTFDSVCNSPQSSLHSMGGKDKRFSAQQRPRSAVRNIAGKRSQDIKSMVRTPRSAGEADKGNSKSLTTFSADPKSSPVAESKIKHVVSNKTLSVEDLRDMSNDEHSDAVDDDYISVDASSVTDFPLSSTCLLVQQHKDFIRCLPVHLSKFVLSYLDKASLTNCLCISKHWRILSEEVQKDAFVHQIMIEEVMMMQGATAKGLNPKYAKKLLVCIPKSDEDETKAEPKNAKLPSPTDTTRRRRRQQNELQIRSMAYCYEGIETTQVEMEERNLFCGAYNVFVLQDAQDPNRCTTFSGGHLVACGSSDRRVRLLDATTGRSEKNIKGHAGSVRCLLISEKRGVVLSGSYDTSVRCWDIRQGNCKCIFRGHRATVLCLALSSNNLASGSRDKSVKVWNFETGRCRRTFRHRHVVLSIDVSDSIVVSGCEGCKIKVWEIESATLVKTLEGHQNPITGITFNKYHIISSSTDCYALAWSAIGKHKKCLQAFRHQKEVLCVKLMYCRAITGAADGKIRVWNLLNGDCLRVIRGNSKNDVITSLYIADNRIVVNTLSNLLILNFEAVTLNYNLPPDRPESLGKLNNYSKCPPRRRPRSYVRAQKQARGAYVENLISGPALSCPAFSGYFDRLVTSVSMTPLTLQASSLSRVSSAPANVTSDVTRQLSRSIDQHVQRLIHARGRPHSSPAKLRQSKGRHEPASPDKATTLLTDDIQPNVLVKNLAPRPKPDPLPRKHSWHALTRGRSAPAVRTMALPDNERGWTTTMRGEATVPHNKLMPTAAEAREFLKRRPKSAQVVMGRERATADPLKSASCLHLKTYSAHVEKQVALQKEDEENEKYPGRKIRTPQVQRQRVQRPHSCRTY